MSKTIISYFNHGVKSCCHFLSVTYIVIFMHHPSRWEAYEASYYIIWQVNVCGYSLQKSVDGHTE